MKRGRLRVQNWKNERHRATYPPPPSESGTKNSRAIESAITLKICITQKNVISAQFFAGTGSVAGRIMSMLAYMSHKCQTYRSP
jgi:hypothetical protein